MVGLPILPGNRADPSTDCCLGLVCSPGSLENGTVSRISAGPVPDVLHRYWLSVDERHSMYHSIGELTVEGGESKGRYILHCNCEDRTGLKECGTFV